jgi:hypothetical protein
MFHSSALEDGERYLISDYEMEVKTKSIQFWLVQSNEGLSLKRMQDRFDDDYLPGGKGIHINDMESEDMESEEQAAPKYKGTRVAQCLKFVPRCANTLNKSPLSYTQ